MNEEIEPADKFDMMDFIGPYHVLDDITIEFQVIALREMIARNAKAETELQNEMEAVKNAPPIPGDVYGRAEEEYGEVFYRSIFQEAVHSMSAVGSLSPFFETLFHRAFIGINKRFFEEHDFSSLHPRFQLATAEQWDCHFYWKKDGSRGQDLVRGILQLAEATGLQSYLPGDFRSTLEALFEYRNKMLHLGFEWPEIERERFQKRIAEAGWPSAWFSKATTGDKPWVFYLTPEFTQHCIGTIEKVLAALTAYCKVKYGERGQPYRC